MIDCDRQGWTNAKEERDGVVLVGQLVLGQVILVGGCGLGRAGLEPAFTAGSREPFFCTGRTPRLGGVLSWRQSLAASQPKFIFWTVRIFAPGTLYRIRKAILANQPGQTQEDQNGHHENDDRPSRDYTS